MFHIFQLPETPETAFVKKGDRRATARPEKNPDETAKVRWIRWAGCSALQCVAVNGTNDAKQFTESRRTCLT